MTGAVLARVGRWGLARAENVAATMIAVMILSFLYQIVVRYLFSGSAAWAEEVCVIMWVWAVLWGTAVVSRPVDDIRIDLITVSVSDGWRRAIDAVTSLVLIVLFLIGLPGAWNYVTFMKIETTAALAWRFNWVFAVYVLFSVAVVVRQAFVFWQAVTGRGVQRFAEGREAVEVQAGGS